MSARPEQIALLVQRAYDDGWNPETDLAWQTSVEAASVEVPDRASLSSPLRDFKALSRDQQSWLKRCEMASHLSNLAFGEGRAATLAAETTLLCPEPDGSDTWFLGTLMADESKHQAVLSRYLREKLQIAYAPHPVLKEVFSELTHARDYGLNLFVGQVVLEGSAASLLTSLLMGMDEPLLKSILQRVMRDEARHMKFAWLAGVPSLKEMSVNRRRRMENLLFEAAVAGAASLLPLRAWEDSGLDTRSCVPAAVDELIRRGIVRFYTRVMTAQLRRRGFPSERLEGKLDRLLESRLRSLR